MKRQIALALAFALAFPPVLIADDAVRPAAEAVGRAFLEGKPLEQIPVEGADAELQSARVRASAVQKGPAATEAEGAYADRVRAAARDLGLKDADVEAAVAVYARRGGAAPASPAGNAERDRRLAAESGARSAGAGARADRIAGQFSAGASPEIVPPGAGGGGSERTMTPERMQALNAIPEAQGGPPLRPGEVAAPASEPAAPTWAASLQGAASEKLRAAQAVVDDGSIGSWAEKNWLMTKGVGQFIAGKAVDADAWSSLWRGAKDVGSYPDYAYGAGKAVVLGVVDDFTGVYHSGAKLIDRPDQRRFAEFGTATASLVLDFAGLGVPAAAKTAGKVGVEVAAKEAVELAVKSAGETAVKDAGKAAVKDAAEAVTEDATKAAAASGGAAATRTAERGLFRERNKDLILANLRIESPAERAAAVRGQMPGLTPEQVEAVLKSHEEFPCAGKECMKMLRAKTEGMREAGMTHEQIGEALDRGLAGRFTNGILDWWDGVESWNGAVKDFRLTPGGDAIVRKGSGALDGVNLTKDGKRLTAEVRKMSPGRLPMGDIKVKGKPIYAGQMEASSTIISEYALMMTNGTWDWAKCPKIVLQRGTKGEVVVKDGHHRVMAAALAGETIPEAAFAWSKEPPRVAYRWSEMRWGSQ